MGVPVVLLTDVGMGTCFELLVQDGMGDELLSHVTFFLFDVTEIYHIVFENELIESFHVVQCVIEEFIFISFNTELRIRL